MSITQRSLTLIGAIVLLSTIAALWFLGGVDPEVLKAQVRQAGFWGPGIYMLIYALATTLLLPSTVLNLAGGALFGTVWGTLWTSIGAILAALLTFWFSRSLGRAWVIKQLGERLGPRWQAIDAEIQQGGLFYLFSLRLLPIIPYGIVNGVAGLTSISFRDYALGTLLGTVPGIFPFVMLGDAGLEVSQKREAWPLVLPLALIGLLVGGATWYRRRRQPPSPG